LGDEVAQRIIFQGRAGENTTVSFHGHVAPSEAHQVEKWVSTKLINHALMTHVQIPFEYLKSTIRVGKGNVRSNHLMPLVQVLYVCAMLGKRHQITNPKAHHSK
jgi:hypothetical protein